MCPKHRSEVAALPSYFVAARHGTTVLGESGPSWQPYGIQHARSLGSSRTECGLSALNWRIFWELPFPGTRGPTCPDCLKAVGLEELRARPKDAPRASDE